MNGFLGISRLKAGKPGWEMDKISREFPSRDFPGTNSSNIHQAFTMACMKTAIGLYMFFPEGERLYSINQSINHY
jgi:hypothetical protein